MWKIIGIAALISSIVTIFFFVHEICHHGQLTGKEDED